MNIRHASDSGRLIRHRISLRFGIRGEWQVIGRLPADLCCLLVRELRDGIEHAFTVRFTVLPRLGRQLAAPLAKCGAKLIGRAFVAIWGKNDPFFLPAGAEAFKRDNPKAEVRFVDSGHLALETHGQEIAAAMLDFLNRHIER